MTDEKFFAWLDGELTGSEAADVAAQVASDPELSARAEQHRALSARLQAAFAPIASAPVPDRLSRAVDSQPDNVLSFAPRASQQQVRQSPPLWKQVAAMAATLAIGIAAGDALIGGSSSPVAPEAGRLVASAGLEEALYTRLASNPPSEGPRIGLTFRDKGGKLCRTFTDQAASGLACLEGGDWRIRGLVQPPEGQQSEYRMAAGMDPNLAAMIDSSIEGEPLDAEQEKAALERGWR